MRKGFALLALLGLPLFLFAQSTDEMVNLSFQIDKLWVLIAAALVFFMQAGFLTLELGLVRSQTATSIGIKNGIDFVVGALGFYMVGFALMFGHSASGFIGTDTFFLNGIETNEGGSNLGFTFFIFQLGFAVTAITIVSGALAARVGFISYLLTSLMMGLLIYPVFGHWVWGSGFYDGNSGWLGDLGFIDFAGSTVVHSVGGWMALVGAIILGPRLGRYKSDGSMAFFKPSNIGIAFLGVFILWLGWFGFNGGSTLAFSADVDDIIVNTTMAAVVGGLVAFFHSFFFQKKEDIYEKLIGGILSGLVAITAGCHIVTIEGAMAIGAIAGVLHNVSYNLIIRKFKIDDAVGAVPVHGVSGAVGTISLVFFAKEGTLENPFLLQLGIQLLGVVVCLVWTVVMGVIVFKVIEKTIGLRLSPEEEKAGLSIPGMMEEEPEEDIDIEALKALMKE
ncbi:MAG: hypothetical protein CMB80_04910 [Flammeovirgaceae bacterium]|nr:hypothetical protein [Flammeovirgaceae bacterium]MBE63639.1 hypothetical protein [Flammeovirgaceae bacterium]MBR11017.1 hypothetical protein [Rickettsiales bacterium]HCX22555.1 hypothetical protein [Cytophagales bacterium]